MKKYLFILYSVFLCSILQAAECEEETAWSRLNIKHKQSEGMGYHDGYSSMQLYSATKMQKGLFFTDLRAHQFVSGKGAGNIGLGYRYSFLNDELMVGVNTYYDIRQGRKRVFHQIGTGIECLSNYVDLRVNGYFPLGVREENLHCFFSELSPNRFLGVRKFHRSLTGVDGELGRKLFCHKKITCYGAGGLYYFQKGNCSTNLGLKGRVKGFFGDFVSLEAILTYDSVFKTKVQGQATLSIPLFPHTKSRKKACSDEYRWNLPAIAQLPERNDMIVFTKGTQRTFANAWVTESNEVVCQTFFSAEPVFENEYVFKSLPPEILTTEEQVQIEVLEEQSREDEPVFIETIQEDTELLIETPEETYFLNRFLNYIKSVFKPNQ